MARNEIHGHSGGGGTGRKASKTYNAWSSMKRRCYDPKVANYKHYGGRGITYNPAWEKFEVFLADMGEAPEGAQLDRIDNAGPYCKENCRWATPTQNSNNKRNNVRLTFQGETLTQSEWARRTGLSKEVIHSRLKRGWSIEEALTTPATVGRNQR